MERFRVNDCYRFHLAKLPRNWEEMLEEAKEYCEYPTNGLVHQETTTDFIQQAPTFYDTTPDYGEFIKRPAVVVYGRFFYLLLLKKRWDFVGLLKDSGTSGERAEFISKFFHWYHLREKELTVHEIRTPFGFLKALVSPKRDIDSKARFQDAIVSTVAKRRSEDRTCFNAIILLIKHFVLVRVTDDVVQHTKCLSISQGIWKDVN
ncbi:hypothetical protein K469DRAFT_694291 [Zopfia rhizophila CBS 207.26]|uniref:Uncharacterized protein n=1 Tax=Zopfia rhizophila CBS 207.26 TaxID=1314779 RepID=A0A6A6ELV8_9PEZI|nr:hypothetical protein K469DRAFT_694291 [Zopfia rhizophila CBS 207.26]